MPQLGFPIWLRAAHILNVLFLSLLIRSGLEILSAHPKLNWHDDCRPGSEWLELSSTAAAADRLRTSHDEETAFPSLIALPGHRTVERPLRLSLAELEAMPRQSQITKHCCIQGWSGVAEWSGLPLCAILERCRPRPAARYAVFHALDDKGQSEPDLGGRGYFYETIDLELARHPQTRDRVRRRLPRHRAGARRLARGRSMLQPGSRNLAPARRPTPCRSSD